MMSETNSIPAAGSVARQARLVARLSHKRYLADLKLKAMMEERYGVHDEMPDSLVEMIEYGANGDLITAKMMDEEMTAEGFPPPCFIDPMDLRTDDCI